MGAKKKSSNGAGDESESCEIAWDIAVEEAFSVCGTKEGKNYIFCQLSKFLGISEDESAKLMDDKGEAVLKKLESKKDRGAMEFNELRMAVVAKAWELMNTGASITTSMDEAWSYIRDKCAEDKRKI